MLSGHGVVVVVKHLGQISRAGLGDYGGGLSALLGASLELKEEGRRESGCAEQLLGTDSQDSGCPKHPEQTNNCL